MAVSPKALITETSLTDAANAIRSKLGVSTTFYPHEMGDAIRSIPVGRDDIADSGLGWVTGASNYTSKKNEVIDILKPSDVEVKYSKYDDGPAIAVHMFYNYTSIAQTYTYLVLVSTVKDNVAVKNNINSMLEVAVNNTPIQVGGIGWYMSYGHYGFQDNGKYYPIGGILKDAPTCEITSDKHMSDNRYEMIAMALLTAGIIKV